MMKHNEILLNTLIKDEAFILLVNCDDSVIWNQWIKSNPDKKQIAEEAKSIILSMQFKTDFPSVEKIKHIQDKIEDSILLLENPRGSIMWNQWIRRAAVLFFAVSITAILYFFIDFASKKTGNDVAVNLIEKTTHKGQKLSTNLIDGSKVTLNSQSKISYELPFTNGERIVHLEGEAFFEVAKDSSRPFKVIANGITTTAIGTSFNVKSDGKETVEVSLVSGKVTVENENNDVILLNPGEVAITSKLGDIKMKTFEYLHMVAWKDGILVFDNTTFPEIFERLEIWYGVTIKVQNMNKEVFHYSASYENLSLAEVLDGVSFVKHFQYSINGDVIEINFKPKK